MEGDTVFKYIIKRVLLAMLTVWIVITLTFTLIHAAPGDPFTREGRMPEAVKANLMKHYNLDKPFWEQYVIYLKNLAKLDFGPSTTHASRTVNDYIKDNFPTSAHLAIQALVISSVLGVLLGIIAALNRNRWPDYICMILSIIGISVPSFIMATILIDVFAVKLHFVPTSGWNSMKHTILPTIALGFMPLAYVARMMRSSMLEVLGQDYIKTAKSKGLSKRKIITRHALRNSIIPVITVLGISAANMLVGSFIIERIFRIPGMGKYFIQSVTNRDHSVILGTTIFYSCILILMNLLVDISYPFLDPRIKLKNVKKKRKKLNSNEQGVRV